MQSPRPLDRATIQAAVPPGFRPLLDALAGHATDLGVWFVGGTVRDLRWGLPLDDLDIAIGAPPNDVASLLAKFSRQSLGIAREPQPVPELGVINLQLEGGLDVALSSFRGEADYGPDRRPRRVTFDVSLDDDAKRRDFTLNACYARWPDAQLVDPCGGLIDQQDGVLRMIGAPDDRFAEDPLRVLRAVRFAVRYDLRIEPATWAALRRATPRCRELVAARQYAELTGALCAAPAASWRILAESGLLLELLPELAHTPAEAETRRGVTLASVPPLPGAVWAALLGPLAEPDVQAILERLEVPRRVRREIEVLARWSRDSELAEDPQRTARGVDPELLRTTLPILLGAGRAERLLAVLRGGGGHAGVALVQAERLRRLGVTDGPALGEALRRARIRLAAGVGEPEAAEVAAAIRDAVADTVKRTGGDCR